MASYILTTKSVILCPHGGPIKNIQSSTKRPVIDGGFPLLINDTFTIVGCAMCTTVNWAGASNRYLVNKVPVLTNTSIGICTGGQGIGWGPAQIVSFQTKVRDT